MDIMNKKYKIFDNIVEIIAVCENRVRFETYKIGEKQKYTGECDIRLFINIEDLDQYILSDINNY